MQMVCPMTSPGAMIPDFQMCRSGFWSEDLIVDDLNCEKRYINQC